MGHITRGDSLLRNIIEGRMEGKKKRARSKMMLLDWMMKGLGLQQVEGESWNDAIGRTNMPMKS